MYDVILKKRQSLELNEEEINFFIDGYIKGEIPDYQVSALLMAIFLNGMTLKEAQCFTRSMVESGQQMDLSDIEGIKVDKHSTGGVGDKTTLIVAPLVASLGVPVAKMSGRGLAHTGGTIDKLESIPGFNVDMSIEKFKENVNDHKIAIGAQTFELAPADKLMYQLRDVTATVESIPLIAGSIMSKKIASGADCIVLDVKVGKGAFLKDVDSAIELAELMVGIGHSYNRGVAALITEMNQPLGNMIGNSLEVIESINTLQGKGPQDLYDLCLEIASYMVVLGKKAKDQEEAKILLRQSIESGKALNKLAELIKIQGGDERYITNPDLFSKAKFEHEVKAEKSGYISGIDAEKLGYASMILGAGRATKEDSIDYSVGLELHKKVGDQVNIGDKIVTIHANDDSKINEAIGMINNSYSYSENCVQKPELIKASVTESGVKVYGKSKILQNI